MQDTDPKISGYRETVKNMYFYSNVRVKRWVEQFRREYPNIKYVDEITKEHLRAVGGRFNRVTLSLVLDQINLYRHENPLSLFDSAPNHDSQTSS